jgi:glycosyltransferase involved in cell wall biosynthesis
MATGRPPTKTGGFGKSSLSTNAMRPGILQVAPHLEDGTAARAVLATARRLVADGWRSCVASGGGPLERELAAQGSAHVRMTVETTNPLTLSTNIGKLGKAIREHRVELVHAQSRAAAWSASYAAKRAGIAFVTSFETAYQGGDGGLTRRWNAVMAQGARIIASSEYLADHIAQTYGVEASRLRIVRQGVDLDAFDPERMRGHRMTKLAERWHLGVERKVVMVPGAIVRRRGHLVMLDAIQRLERSDFLLLICGDLGPKDPYSKELEERIRERGLEDRVQFAGGCDDWPAAFSLADLVVLPATAEATDLEATALIEAQAMGKPVIVSNVGALGEAVLVASTGWLIPPDDPAELAWALDLALSLEAQTRERLAERARAFVMREYSTEQSARRTIAVYRELVKNAPRSSDPEMVVERLAIPQIS